MRDAHNRNLIVVARSSGEVGLGVELQEGFGLIAEAVSRNIVVRERRAGGRIEELYRLPESVQRLGEVTVALGQGWHQGGQRGGVAVAGPLIVEDEIGAVP